MAMGRAIMAMRFPSIRVKVWIPMVTESVMKQILMMTVTTGWMHPMLIR
jgi:hypothetical protein